MKQQNQLFQISGETWQGLDPEEVKATITAMKEAQVYALPFPRVDLRLPLVDAGHTSRLYPDNLIRQRYVDEFVQNGLLVPLSNERVQRMHITDEAYKIGDTARMRAVPGQQLLQFNFGPDSWLDILDLSLTDTNYRTCIRMGPNNPRFHGPFRYETRSIKYNSPEERNLWAHGLIVLLATRNAVKITEHNKRVKLGIGKSKHLYEYTTTITMPRELEADVEHPPTGTTRAPHLRRGHIRRQHHGPKNSFVKSIFIEPVFVNADLTWVNNRKAYNVSL